MKTSENIRMITKKHTLRSKNARQSTLFEASTKKKFGPVVQSEFPKQNLIFRAVCKNCRPRYFSEPNPATCLIYFSSQSKHINQMAATFHCSTGPIKFTVSQLDNGPYQVLEISLFAHRSSCLSTWRSRFVNNATDCVYLETCKHQAEIVEQCSHDQGSNGTMAGNECSA